MDERESLNAAWANQSFDELAAALAATTYCPGDRWTVTVDDSKAPLGALVNCPFVVAVLVRDLDIFSIMARSEGRALPEPDRYLRIRKIATAQALKVIKSGSVDRATFYSSWLRIQDDFMVTFADMGRWDWVAELALEAADLLDDHLSRVTDESTGLSWADRLRLWQIVALMQQRRFDDAAALSASLGSRIPLLDGILGFACVPPRIFHEGTWFASYAAALEQADEAVDDLQWILDHLSAVLEGDEVGGLLPLMEPVDELRLALMLQALSSIPVLHAFCLERAREMVDKDEGDIEDDDFEEDEEGEEEGGEYVASSIAHGSDVATPNLAAGKHKPRVWRPRLPGKSRF